MKRVDYDRVAFAYDRRVPRRRGAAVLDDPILTRDGTCQLSLLSDHEFDRGLTRIRSDAARGDAASFRTDLRIFATTGRKA